MNLRVILMCGGKQTRMGTYDGAKQLVPVCGVPNAERTVSLLSVYHAVSLCVVAPQTPEWREAFSVADLVPPADPLFLAAAADALKGRWYSRYMVLCGDVVFSPTVLESLVPAFSGDPSIIFAGRFVPNIHTGRAAGELYGFSFGSLDKDLVLKGIDTILAEVDVLRATMRRITDDPARIEDVVEKNARLWRLMHLLEEEGAEVKDVPLWDYTDDIDGPDDLERLPRIEAAIRRRSA